MSTTPVAFDPQTYIKEANEREAARAAGKAVEPAAATAKTDDAAVRPKLPRSAVRQMNELRERAARAEERAKVIEELGLTKPQTEKTAAAGTSGEAAAVVDPEPMRKDFGSDADYHRALGRWDARQEASKVIEKKTTDEGQIAQYRQALEEANAKFDADKATLPDFDELTAAVIEEEKNGDRPTFNVADHPIFLALVAQSDQKAFILHHFAKNADALKAFLELEKNPVQLIAKFNRLEGRMEKEYDASEKKQKAKGKSAAELDAAKPAPSESATVKAGTAAPGKVETTITDGKGRRIMNPEWLRQENEKRGVRP